MAVGMFPRIYLTALHMHLQFPSFNWHVPRWRSFHSVVVFGGLNATRNVLCIHFGDTYADTGVCRNERCFAWRLAQHVSLVNENKWACQGVVKSSHYCRNIYIYVYIYILQGHYLPHVLCVCTKVLRRSIRKHSLIQRNFNFRTQGTFHHCPLHDMVWFATN